MNHSFMKQSFMKQSFMKQSFMKQSVNKIMRTRDIRQHLALRLNEWTVTFWGHRQWQVMAAMLIWSCLVVSPAGAQQGWEAPPLLDGAIKVTAEEILDLKAEFADLVIIDARPSNESNGLSIEGAVSVTDRSLSPHTLAAMTKDKFTPLLIYGADEHSIHGYKAARQAVTLGYAYVFWFRGGLQEWLNKGMPVVRAQK
jgi:rhodanese-related sulfurtransferase